MTKRILDATASDFLSMNAVQLVQSIRITEGRTIAAEVICTYEPPVEGVTHAEIAAAFGADIIALDHYDPDIPLIRGLPKHLAEQGDILSQLKRLIGRPVAVNMAVTRQNEGEWLYTRRYSSSRLETLVRQGADILFLYGDPVSTQAPQELVKVVREIRDRYPDQLVLVCIPDVLFPPPVDQTTFQFYKQAHEQILEAGAQCIGLVMPGSKQGWRTAEVAELVDHIHQLGGLAWLIMTGSVEGSSRETIQQMAINAKMVGGDVYRLDEAGLSGMSLPENIFEFSLAIRGKRHTYRRMALSVLR